MFSFLLNYVIYQDNLPLISVLEKLVRAIEVKYGSNQCQWVYLVFQPLLAIKVSNKLIYIGYMTELTIAAVLLKPPMNIWPHAPSSFNVQNIVLKSPLTSTL